jgi:hypothetical protein
MARILHSSPKSPLHWRDFYKAVFLELDLTKIPTRIAEAEDAMSCRAQELLQKPGDSSDEEQALDDAAYVLRALRSAVRISSGSDHEERVWLEPAM